MSQRNGEPKFVLCVHNKKHPASLELRKLYRVLPDASAAKHNMIRIIDESGEDYLYPVSFFVSVKLSARVEKALLLAS